MKVQYAFVLLCSFGIFVWYSQLMFLKSFNQLIQKFHISSESTTYKEPIPEYNCSKTSEPPKVEDILCMPKKKFLKNFKNPCWYEEHSYFNGTQMVSSTRLRCLPYFYIFGVCKSGTTDLFFRMTHHPDIVNNWGELGKETWYWTWRRHGFMSPHHIQMNFTNFLDMFKAQIIGQTKISIRNGTTYSNFITGHGDPMDFWDNRFWRDIPQNDPSANTPRVLVPHLVRHLQPNIKLIVMLRDPTERLYSHYYHGGFGSSKEEFHNDVVDAMSVMQACGALYSIRTCLFGKNITSYMNVPLTASLYYLHLRDWLDVFPREQILIIRNEDYAANVEKTLMEVFRYLDVDDITSGLLKHIVNLPHKYETKAKQHQGPMKNETLDLLLDFFEGPNEKLALMLNDTRFLWRDVKRKFGSKAKTKPVRKREKLTRNNVKVKPPQNVYDKTKYQQRKERWETLKNQQAKRIQEKKLAKERIQAEQFRIQAFLQHQHRLQMEMEKNRQMLLRLREMENERIKRMRVQMGLQSANENDMSPSMNDHNLVTDHNRQTEAVNATVTLKNENTHKTKKDQLQLNVDQKTYLEQNMHMQNTNRISNVRNEKVLQNQGKYGTSKDKNLKKSSYSFISNKSTKHPMHGGKVNDISSSTTQNNYKQGSHVSHNSIKNRETQDHVTESAAPVVFKKDDDNLRNMMISLKKELEEMKRNFSNIQKNNNNSHINFKD